MDPNLNLSKIQLDVIESADADNQMISNQHSDSNDVMRMDSECHAPILYAEGYYSCDSRDGGGDVEQKDIIEVLANEEVLTTSRDSQNGDVEPIKETCYSVCMPECAEDEQANQSLLTSSNDINVVTQSYYITVDDKTGEHYAILTLDGTNSNNQESKPTTEDSICINNESESDKDLGNAFERQRISQHHSPMATLQVAPSYDQSTLLENSCCSPQYHSGLVSQTPRSYDCTHLESKRFQPYCDRPLQASTPNSSNNASRRMTCSSCYSSYSSVSLNSAGEETSSSSDNASHVMPRVPNNTPDSNFSMSSQMPPPMQGPQNQSVFESSIQTSSQSSDSSCIREFRFRPRPGIATNCPKEMHNEKERFRRGSFLYGSEMYPKLGISSQSYRHLGRIKKACLMLRETVPGLSDKTDKATVLETTVRYIYHLKNNAAQGSDQDFLEKSYKF